MDKPRDAGLAEVRLYKDGTLDEVVGEGKFHLEQMDYDEWYIRLGNVSVWLSTKHGAHIDAVYERETDI